MIIGIEEVMKLTGVGRLTATRYLNTKGCPTLPRVKGAPYRVDQDAFLKWLRREMK